MSQRIKVAALFLVILALAITLNTASKSRTIQASSIAPPADSEPVLTQQLTYNGKHSDWVRKLLTRVGGWKCPANAADSGTPPTVKADECMRDKYVTAAVLYAWAAECYTRNEEDTKAADAADYMYKQLKSADFAAMLRASVPAEPATPREY